MGRIHCFARRKKGLLIRTVTILVPLMLTLLLLSQPAFAQNTYVITDGQRVFTYTTYATDPEDVLDEAGLKLGEGDSFTTEAGTGAATITIQRSQYLTVLYYGETIEVTSRGETVEALLRRLNLEPGPDDVVSRPLDSMTSDGLVLRVEKVQRLEQSYTSAITHDVSYCYDPELPEGTRTVLVEGVDGQAACTATVTYVNGEETDRVLTSQVVVRNPVTELIALGTAPETTADPDGMPIIGEGTITLPTGEVLTYTDTMQVLATAYHKSDAGCDDWTATMTLARVGAIAVDPRVIPYGTRMFIVSNDGEYIYGLATAEDCGGAIKGARIDLYYDTVAECNAFGRRGCTIYFLG